MADFAQQQPAKKKSKILGNWPSDFKKNVFSAAADADYNKLRCLLGTDETCQIVTQSQGDYTDAECAQLFRGLLSSKTDNYTNKHDDFMLCLDALLADRRTTPQMKHKLLSRIWTDTRDWGDVADLVLDYSPEVSINFLFVGVHESLFGGKHRILESVIYRPGYNVNRWCDQDERVLHYAIHASSIAPQMPYSSDILPVILRHPLLVPDLRQKYVLYADEFNEEDEVIYRTALSLADSHYGDAVPYQGTSLALAKQRAARNVRLLLADDRVDVHQMQICTFDPGY